MEHKVTETTCPVCSAQLDGASNAEPGVDAAPQPSDITICASCASLLQFTETLDLKLMDADQIQEEDRPLIESIISTIKRRIH